jgi:hypothetical protein
MNVLPWPEVALCYRGSVAALNALVIIKLDEAKPKSRLDARLSGG